MFKFAVQCTTKAKTFYMFTYCDVNGVRDPASRQYWIDAYTVRRNIGEAATLYGFLYDIDDPFLLSAIQTALERAPSRDINVVKVSADGSAVASMPAQQFYMGLLMRKAA